MRPLQDAATPALEFEETITVFFKLESRCCSILQGSHVLGIVLFVNAERSLRELCIIKCLFELDCGGTDNVVALEEISIVGLHSKGPILGRVLNLIVKTVVKAGFSCLTSVVGISFKCFLRVEE